MLSFKNLTIYTQNCIEMIIIVDPIVHIETNKILLKKNETINQIFTSIVSKDYPIKQDWNIQI